MDTTTNTPATSIGTRPVDVAAALYGALAAGDLAQAAELLAQDVVLHVPGSHPLAGTYAGADAVVGFVVASSTRADRTENIELLDLLDGATHAAAYCRVTGERQGVASLDNTTVHVLRVEDGRVAELWFHNWDQAAVDAFWA